MSGSATTASDATAATRGHGIPATVVAAVRRVLGEAQGQIGLHEPRFDGREWEYVKECLDTGWVSSAGRFVDRLERDLCTYTGATHAIATVNGTAALHLALILAGVSRDDEVVVPALSFVATANAVTYCGAVPHFADVSSDTLGLDPLKLSRHFDEIVEMTARGVCNRRTGRRLAAVVAMHTFGHPVDLDPLLEVCARYRLPLVEDAAESLGSTYKERHCGTIAPISALSFNGNKVVTTGGGGAVLTSDAALAQRAKHLSTTAKVPHRWNYDHDRLGFNYRMPNINAALGCAQLEQLDAFVADKRALASRYDAAFAACNQVRFFRERTFARSNYWLNAIQLDASIADQRDEVLMALNDAGYQARPAWTLLPDLPFHRDAPSMADLSVARNVQRTLINLPSSVGIGGMRSDRSAT